MMTPKTEAEFAATLARLEEKIDGIKEDVSDINHRLYGNGKPGILSDQQKQDITIEQLLGYAKANSDNIKRLDELVVPNWFQKNWWKLTIAMTLLFVLLHSLLPEGISVWQLFQLLK